MAADDPTAGSRAEQATVAWLNQIDSAEPLLATLVPDPRRVSQAPADPIFTLLTAQAMLDARTALGGPFVSTAQVQAAAGVTPRDLADLMHTGRAMDEQIMAGQSVGVLLPLRIETRFVPPADGQLTWKLWLRLYPEAASFDRHPGPPTQDEYDHTLEMWQAANGDLGSEAGKLAFQKLAEQHQGAPAAWLARTLLPRQATPADPITLPAVPIRTPDDRRFQTPVGLPQRLEVWLGRAGAAPAKAADLPVQGDLIAQEVGPAGWGDGAAGMPQTWWLSFQRSLDLGLGAIIDLGDHADDIDVLYVVGLGAEAPDKLFAAHGAAGTLAVVPPGTPTNTVAGAPAADLGRDPDLWRRMAWAMSAAILRDLGLRDPMDPRWNMTLDSSSIRAAARLATDVQAGIQFERSAGSRDRAHRR